MICGVSKTENCGLTKAHFVQNTLKTKDFNINFRDGNHFKKSDICFVFTVPPLS
jgi:hypothetical protein